ncbi:MAG: hypothetical protein WA738_05040, partial [Candidatus Angelobacter sp.]
MKNSLITLGLVLSLAFLAFSLKTDTLASTKLQAASSSSSISSGVYSVLSARATSNQNSFFVYRDQDDGLNHGFPSGFFGAFDHITLDAGCIDDPASTNGCSSDTTKLDRTHGTVLRITIAPLSPQTFAGVNIEEPENWGVLQT